jgi:hypothetical protein
MSLLQSEAFFPSPICRPSRRSDPSSDTRTERRTHLCKLPFALVPPFSGSHLSALHVVTARRPRILPPHSVIARDSLPLRTAVAQIPTSITLAPSALPLGLGSLHCSLTLQVVGSADPPQSVLLVPRSCSVVPAIRHRAVLVSLRYAACSALAYRTQKTGKFALHRSFRDLSGR